MSTKPLLLGAAGALVMSGAALAQIAGGVGGAVSGQVTAPTPAVPAVPATPAVPSVRAPATPAVPATPATPSARAAATAGADVSARTEGRAMFPAGTVVRDSAGVQIGVIMEPEDDMVRASGRVTIRTSTGFITVPRGALTMDGEVAVSKKTEAELRATGQVKVR
ncbi:MAG: hypothetical protein ACOY4K_07960 [Pseudomonadota bacterium]